MESESKPGQEARREQSHSPKADGSAGQSEIRLNNATWTLFQFPCLYGGTGRSADLSQ